VQSAEISETSREFPFCYRPAWVAKQLLINLIETEIKIYMRFNH
jgi:hypothetical protein